MHGDDSTPSHNHQTLLPRESRRRMWDRGNYPRASPLTLTGITKGPKNRGKGKKKETKEEKGNEGCTKIKESENQCPLQPKA